MRDRDDVAFDALFANEYSHVVRCAYLIVRDEGTAEEIAQETFTRALSRWRRLVNYERPEAWLQLVAVRLALRQRGRREREREYRDVVVAADERSATTIDLKHAILRLPQKQRAVVVLYYLHDLPIAEVAAALRIRPSTARVHLHRARANLAVSLGKEFVNANHG